MLKAEKLFKWRGYMIRACKAVQIPYHNPCMDTNCDFNKAMRAWQFNYRLQQEMPKPPSPCQQRRTVSPPVDHCSPYTVEELRSGPYNTIKYQKVTVTKEQRFALDRYAARTRFGGSGAIENPIVVNDQLEPGLANYMRTVMEHNTFYNKLFCIDYYKQYDDGSKAGKSSPDYMDLNEVARLLELLAMGAELSPDELAYLQQFLKQLALLDIAEMSKYLAMFDKLGLITSSVLNILQEMLLQFNIDPARLQALNTVLSMALEKAVAKEMAAAAAQAAAEEAAANAQARKSGYLNDDKGTIKRSQPVFDADGFDASGLDKNGLDRNGFDKDGFDANGFNKYGLNRDGRNKNGFRPGQLPKPQPAKSQTQGSDDRKSRERTSVVKVLSGSHTKPEIPRKRPVAQCGKLCKGYYEPWDADLSWEDAQELVARSINWRMNRIEWKNFHYTRARLEKYQAEFEREKPKITEPPTQTKKRK